MALLSHDLPEQVWEVAELQRYRVPKVHVSDAIRSMQELIVDDSRVAQAATVLCRVIDKFSVAGQPFEPSEDAELMADLLTMVENEFPDMTPDEFEEVFEALQDLPAAESHALAA